MFPLFIDASGALHPALFALLSILNIPHDNTLSSVVEQTQKTLLRKKDQERWEVDPLLFEDKREQLLPLLAELGFVESVPPLPSVYEELIVFGFVSSDVGSHIGFLNTFLPQIRMNRSVLLTSSLPLPDLVPGAHCATEAHVMEELYKKSNLAIYPYSVINVPMITIANQTRRPTTDDTVKAWLATRPKPGHCLALSGQPFIRRQTKILQTMAPNTFYFVPTGPAAELNFPVALYLDELARALYQEHKYLMTRPE